MSNWNWFLLVVAALYLGAGVTDIARGKVLWGILWLLFSAADVITAVLNRR